MQAILILMVTLAAFVLAIAIGIALAWTAQPQGQRSRNVNDWNRLMISRVEDGKLVIYDPSTASFVGAIDPDDNLHTDSEVLRQSSIALGFAAQDKERG